MKQLLFAASLLALASAKQSILETGFEALGSLNGADIDILQNLDQLPGGFAHPQRNAIVTAVLKAMDKNENGKVTMEEFEKISEDALDAFFKMIDHDRDGSISEEEILTGGFTIDGLTGMINIVFKVGDINRDGFISTADFMKQGPSSQLSLVGLLDSNKDGRINLQEYQEFGEGDNKLPELPEPLVKAIKLLDKDLDGQVNLEDVDHFVKAALSIFDKDQNGHITVKEQISTLKQHGLTEVYAAKIKKDFTKNQNAIMKITRDIVNEIDGDVDGQVDRNEFIAVLQKPFPDPEMLAKLAESFPGPSMDGSEDGLMMASELEKTQLMNVFDSFLENPKFSEFKSSSSKSIGKYWVICITIIVAFML